MPDKKTIFNLETPPFFFFLFIIKVYEKSVLTQQAIEIHFYFLLSNKINYFFLSKVQMPRPLSDSWQHFDLIPSDSNKNRQAKCRFCGHKQAAGITRLHQHLLFKCTKITANVRNELRQKEEARGRGPSTSQSSVESNTESTQIRRTDYNFGSALLNSSGDQPPSLNMARSEIANTTSGNPTNFLGSNTFPLQSNERSSQRQQSIPTIPQSQSQSNDISQTILDWHLARALFSANIPFEKVENPHFIEFLKCLQPNYSVPKSSRLKQLVLKEQHWDLIDWNESVDRAMNNGPPPESIILSQQHASRSSLSSNAGINNVHKNINTVEDPVLATIHQPPPELEGSL